MSTHKCNKETEINKLLKGQGRLETKVNSIEERLIGNGVKGLIRRIDELTKYMIEQKTKNKLSRGALAIIFTVVTLIAMVVGPIIASIIMKKLG